MARTQFPRQASGPSLQRDAVDTQADGVTLNLKWATLSVEYVRDAVTVGASNKIIDVYASRGMSLICVAAVHSVEFFDVRSLSTKKYLHRIAEILRSTGCGNCGEQSALAFKYLEENGIRPLDWMYRMNGDHAFVVIGRDRGTKDSNYSTWGIDAVVCDPWNEILSRN